MDIQPGIIIIAAPALQDENFIKAVIVITEHNEKGASGFVINKQFSRKFNELLEFKNSPALTLYAGGPVDTKNLFCLHIHPDLVEASQPVFDAVYMGGNFQQTVEQLNAGILLPSQLKLFIGYCGWDKDELENEIEEGSWIITSASSDIIFTADVNQLWENLLEQTSNQ